MKVNLDLATAFLPALGSFGPIFLMMGITSYSRASDSSGLYTLLIGVLMISFAMSLLTLKVFSLQKRVEELIKEKENHPLNKANELQSL